MRGLTLTFHAGLLLPVWILFTADQRLFSLLLPLGTIHVVGLWLLGRRLGVPWDGFAIQTLHKAGFLHTLLGLGAAVLAAAAASGEPEYAVSGVGGLIAPAGASLLPHVLGVWLGHTIEMRRARIGSIEDVPLKVDDSAASTLRLLDQMQNQITRFCALVDESSRAYNDTTRRLTEAANALRASTRASADGVRELQDTITALLRAVTPLASLTEQTRIVLQQTIEFLRTDLVKSDRSGTGR